MLEHVRDVHDVAVPELRLDLPLGDQTIAHLLRADVKQLERVRHVEVEVPHVVDRGDPALAQRANHLEPSDVIAWAHLFLRNHRTERANGTGPPQCDGEIGSPPAPKPRSAADALLGTKRATRAPGRRRVGVSPERA